MAFGCVESPISSNKEIQSLNDHSFKNIFKIYNGSIKNI